MNPKLLKKTALAILFLLVAQLSFSQQSDVEKKTFSIIDTTTDKMEKARKLYDWTTHHISYDVKAYLRGKSTNKTTNDVLKRRDGLSGDCTALFDEMCHIAGLESYIVLGYAKGLGQYKGGEFFRANHQWNVVHIDSTWLIIDPTWGSGYVMRVGTFWQKVRFTLFGTPYIPVKLVFVKSFDSFYFNASPTKFSYTHLPVDPKWQFRPFIFGIRNFEKDTANKNGVPNIYKPELEKVRKLPFNWQKYIEGRNGLEFNANNHFEIAAGYLQRAIDFDDKHEKVTEYNMSLFQDNLDFNKKAKEHIDLYWAMYDSIMKIRLNRIKLEKSRISVVDRFVDKEVAEPKEYRVFSMSVLLKSALMVTNLNGEIARLQGLTHFLPDASRSNSDTVFLKKEQINKLLLMADALVGQLKHQQQEIDSITLEMRQKEIELSSLNAAYLSTKHDFSLYLSEFKLNLFTYDNELIFNKWDKINEHKNSLIKLASDKNKKIASVGILYNGIIQRQLRIEGIRQELNRINDEYYYNMCNPAFHHYIFKTNIELTVNAYHSIINSVDAFKLLKDQEVGFVADNKDITKTIEAENSKINNSLFLVYINDLYSFQKSRYSLEKRAVKQIETVARKSIERITQKLADYENALLFAQPLAISLLRSTP